MIGGFFVILKFVLPGYLKFSILKKNKRNDFVNLVWKRVAEKNNVVERNNLIFKLLDQWNSVNAGDDRTLISYEKK